MVLRERGGQSWAVVQLRIESELAGDLRLKGRLAGQVQLRMMVWEEPQASLLGSRKEGEPSKAILPLRSGPSVLLPAKMTAV